MDPPDEHSSEGSIAETLAWRAKCSFWLSMIPTGWLFTRGFINRPISPAEFDSPLLFVDLVIVVLIPLGAIIMGCWALRGIRSTGIKSSRKWALIGLGFSCYYVGTVLIGLCYLLFFCLGKMILVGAGMAKCTSIALLKGTSLISDVLLWIIGSRAILSGLPMGKSFHVG
jgi:hypothetical protein